MTDLSPLKAKSFVRHSKLSKLEAEVFINTDRLKTGRDKKEQIVLYLEV